MTELRPKPRLIVVEGPIGAGKTSLARNLAASLNYRLLLERPEENPFLEKFYKEDGASNALAVQLCFLCQRAEMLRELDQQDIFLPGRVCDFLHEKDRLFAQINLNEHELRLYDQMCDQISVKPVTPDLVVYLQASPQVLMQRVRGRDIPSERPLRRTYLERVVSSYSDFFFYYDKSPLLIVDSGQVDLRMDGPAYRALLEQILHMRGGRRHFNPGLLREEALRP